VQNLGCELLGNVSREESNCGDNPRKKLPDAESKAFEKHRSISKVISIKTAFKNSRET